MVNRRTVLQGAGGGAIAFAIARFSGFTALAQEATPGASPATGAYPAIEYTASEYKFDGPGSFAGGLTQVTLKNAGTMEHHGMFMKLHDGKTVADLGAAAQQNGIGGLLSVSDSVGGPGSIDPGYSSTVVIDFKPGNYVLVCVIPDADGVPHMAKGMALPITITDVPASQPAAPTADVSVELADFSFTNLPSTVKAGQQTWAITNKGAQLHELALYKLAPGFTIDQLIAIVSGPEATPMPGMDMGTPDSVPAQASPAAGAPPFAGIGGFAPVSPGYGGWLLFDFEAGDYAALCFVPDIKTGKPHFMLGMKKAFTVS
jgi:uncharacterized cupredoxin-like copper-binding protein